jgi:tetratricopeptide (TPR) repeat protein
LRRGGFEEAQRLLQSSLDVLRAADAFVELVDTLQHAGALDRLMGLYPRSRARFEEMLRYATQTDDLWNAAIAEGNIGLADQALGDYQEGRIRMEGTVVAFRALGDNRMLAVALHFLGGTNCMLRSFDRARAYLQESLALSRSIGDRWIEAMTLRELGNVAKETGADTEAAALFSESLDLAREIAEQWSTLQSRNGLGTVRLAMADLDGARDSFSEGLALAWEIQSLPDVLAALCGLARWSARQGLTEATLPVVLASIAVVLDHPAATQKTKDDVRQLWIELEASLKPEQISAAQIQAQTVSFEQVVDLALSTSSLDVAPTENDASDM